MGSILATLGPNGMHSGHFGPCPDPTGTRMGCILATLGPVQTLQGPEWGAFWPLWALSRPHWGPYGAHSAHFGPCPDSTEARMGCILTTLGPVQTLLGTEWGSTGP